MRRRCEGSSHPILAPVPLPLLSQHHTTALPSPKRYGNCYEREDPGRTSENSYSTHSADEGLDVYVHSEVAGGDEEATAGSFASFGVRRSASSSVTTMRMISATGMASNAPGM